MRMVRPSIRAERIAHLSDRRSRLRGFVERSLLMLLLAPPIARAQVFELGGGASTLFGANGGSVEVHGQDYQGWLGIGSLDGHLRFGSSFSENWHGSLLTIGDDIIPFTFPTDVFDGSQYFLGRGAGISRTRGRFTLLVFGGATATGFSAPFFRTASTDAGVGAFFFDVKLAHNLHVFSRNILSNRQTFINGLEWRPETWIKTSVAGGVGANQGYMAYSLTAERPWISFKSAYVLTGDQFHRIVVQSPLYAEVDQGNISVDLHPKPSFNFTASHLNLLEPTTTAQPGIRATLDQISGSASAAQFRFTGSLFRSSVLGITTQGSSVSVGRDLGPRFQASANLFYSRAEKQPSTTSVISTLREVVSPRLSLLQTVTQSSGHTSIAFGGDFLSNPVSFGVSYETVHSPFQIGGDFHQVLLLHVRLQFFGNFQMNLDSYVAPDQSVKYTADGQTFIYGGEEDSSTLPKFGIPKYVVSGRVVDEQGQPVGGAALLIGGDPVFTNSEGEFFVRRKKAKSCSVEVMPAEFLTPGAFDVVSGPSSVTPSKEGSEGPITVIVRHRRASP